MQKKTYGILDIAKLISAFLVIAIHCAPFIEVNEALNFVFVQILARLAVPFFFITSGWLFFQKIDPQKGWRDLSNRQALSHYWGRILKLYLCWSILYLPLLIVSWTKGGFTVTTLIRFLRDVLFNGTYYHLWFLPALLLGVPLVYMLYTTCKRNWMLWITMLLYLIGMGINVYGGVLMEAPVVSTCIQTYHNIFATSRNGLFFAPVYLALGIYVHSFLSQNYKKQAGLALEFSFVLYCGEAFLLRANGIMHDLTSMYLMLVPTVFFLFIFLLQFSIKESALYPNIRKMSLLIYTSHIYFIFLLLQVLKLGNLPAYILSILLSCVFAGGLIKLSHRAPWLKVLM